VRRLARWSEALYELGVYEEARFPTLAHFFHEMFVPLDLSDGWPRAIPDIEPVAGEESAFDHARKGSVYFELSRELATSNHVDYEGRLNAVAATRYLRDTTQ
jgi:hypothetical protein